jgi:hypothetical protein
MEIRLGKVCSVIELKLGQRYSVTRSIIPGFTFVVTDINEHRVTFKYDDNYIGGTFIDSKDVWYEFPFSSLEKELL